MITNAYKKLILENLFGRRTFNIPTTLYFGVSSTDIAPNGSGVTEPPASAGYVRATIPNNETSWSTANSDVIVYNLKDIMMNEITSPCDQITNFFLSDSLTGLPILYEKLKPIDYRPMPKGSTLYIKAGGATFSIGDVV